MSDEKTLDNKQLDMLRMIADTHHRTECASWKLLWLIDQHRALTTALATAIAERDAARAEVERACCRGEPHTCDQERVAAAEGRTDRLIIGALCAAFRHGFDEGWAVTSEGFNAEHVGQRWKANQREYYELMAAPGWGEGWRPGCGRTAGGGR